MPSPVAHSLIGLALGIAWRIPGSLDLRGFARQAWAQRGWLFLCIVLANAPDIDFLFGIPRGNLNVYHQTATHTLVWITLVSLCVWLFARKRHGMPVRGFLFILALTGSHLIADMCCADYRPPYGIMFGWPFSDRFWHSSVSLFPAAIKSTWADLWSWHNAGVVDVEIMVTLPILAAVLWWKLRRGPGA